MKENFKMVYSMKNIWYHNGEKAISFSFDKELVKNFIKILKSDTVKGLDSIYQKSISIFGFVITFGDFNYNRIIHVMINHQKDNYKRSSQKHEITVLKETLLTYMKNNFKNVTTPFNWNCSLNSDTGEIFYYITGKKKWFEDKEDDVVVADDIYGYLVKYVNNFLSEKNFFL